MGECPDCLRGVDELMCQHPGDSLSWSCTPDPCRVIYPRQGRLWSGGVHSEDCDVDNKSSVPLNAACYTKCAPGYTMECPDCLRGVDELMCQHPGQTLTWYCVAPNQSNRSNHSNGTPYAPNPGNHNNGTTNTPRSNYTNYTAWAPNQSNDKNVQVGNSSELDGAFQCGVRVILGALAWASMILHW